MILTHSLVNDAADELEVWVEPWADLYVVRRGAKVAFAYAAEVGIELLESEVEKDRMTFWFSGSEAPEVTIDGAKAEPMDQYEWRRRQQNPDS